MTVDDDDVDPGWSPAATRVLFRTAAARVEVDDADVVTVVRAVDGRMVARFPPRPGLDERRRRARAFAAAEQVGGPVTKAAVNRALGG